MRLGGLPAVTAIFYGVSPAVIALILHSCYRLAKLGMKDKLQWGIAAACLVVTVAVRAEVALLFLASGIMGAIVYGSFRRKPLRAAFGVSLMATTPLGPAAVTSAGPAAGSILARLLFFFLKAGSLTFERRSTARLISAISTVNQSPIAILPSRMHAPRIVPMAAAYAPLTKP